MNSRSPGPGISDLLLPVATGLTVIAASSAHAQIIYSGVQDILVTTTSSADVDFTNGGNPQVTFKLVADANDAKPEVTVNIADFTLANSGNGIYDQLTNGASVESAIASTGSVTGQGTWSANLIGASTTAAPYIGFELDPSGTPLYGWANFSYDGTPADGATVVDWAYQSNGTDILAGDTGMSAVPEPADTALFMGAAALLAGSAALWRKRQLGPVGV